MFRRQEHNMWSEESRGQQRGAREQQFEPEWTVTQAEREGEERMMSRAAPQRPTLWGPPFGAPPFRAPPFGTPPFGAPPFGAPPFVVPLFSRFGPTIQGRTMTHTRSKNGLAKMRLAQIGQIRMIGQSRSLPATFRRPRLVRRMHRQGRALISCRKCSGCARHSKRAQKSMARC